MKHPLQKILEECDYECRSYSGRNMFGKHCLGVSVDNVNIMIANVIRNVIFDKEEIAEAFESMKSDSLGKGTIVYFTSIEYFKINECSQCGIEEIINEETEESNLERICIDKQENDYDYFCQKCK